MFDELLAAGDAYREAQKEAFASGDHASLERAENERKSAVANAQKRAESLLAEGGLSASTVVVSRIVTTLEALASYGHANPNPYDGCASDDLEPPGFAALASLAPASARPRSQPQLQLQPAKKPEHARQHERNDEAEQERKREAERKRRELDVAIDKVATELARATEDVTRAEQELAAAKEREAELAREWERLKGRRREMV